MLQQLDYVLAKLDWMRREAIWPNGLRYLWTDAFGLVLLVSLYERTGEVAWLDQAERLVVAVDEGLGRPRGYRIGEAPDRDGQYFHYLAMWLFALSRLAAHRGEYRAKGVRIAKDVHPAFVIPGVGVIWKMKEDLSGPYPGYGLGALDAFDGYAAYRLLDQRALAHEIAEMKDLIERQYRSLDIDQDLGLGMMLWLAHLFPDEDWAATHRARALEALDGLWVDPPGYFARSRRERRVRFAFTNYGVSLGLQAVGEHESRAERLNAYFEAYRSGDEYERDAITHVMACVSHFPGAFILGRDPAHRQARPGAAEARPYGGA